MYRVIVIFSTLLLTLATSTLIQPDGIVLFKRQFGDDSSTEQAAASTTDQAAASRTSTLATPTVTTDADEVTAGVNITLDGKIFPPNIHVEGLTTTDTTDFIISCVDCSIIGNFGLSAGDTDFGFETPPDVDHRGDGAGFDFSDIWVAATVDSFNATFELGVNLTASNKTNGFDIPLYTQTKSLQYGILTLSATLSTSLHGWVNTTQDVNFTYGFNFGVPAFSEVIVDVNNPEDSTSLGFNETTLTPIPLNSSNAAADVAVSVGVRSSIAFVVTLGNPTLAGASVSLTVGLDLPQLGLDIEQIHNATSACVSAGPNTPTNQIYQNLTKVTPSIGFDTFEVFTESAGILGAKLSGQQSLQQNFTHNLTSDCMFFDTQKGLIAAPATKPAHGVGAAPGGRHAPITSTCLGVVIVAGVMALL